MALDPGEELRQQNGVYADYPVLFGWLCAAVKDHLESARPTYRLHWVYEQVVTAHDALGNGLEPRYFPGVGIKIVRPTPRPDWGGTQDGGGTQAHTEVPPPSVSGR